MKFDQNILVIYLIMFLFGIFALILGLLAIKFNILKNSQDKRQWQLFKDIQNQRLD